MSIKCTLLDPIQIKVQCYFDVVAKINLPTLYRQNETEHRMYIILYININIYIYIINIYNYKTAKSHSVIKIATTSFRLSIFFFFLI